MPHETAAISAHVLCRPCNHAPVYSFPCELASVSSFLSPCCFCFSCFSVSLFVLTTSLPLGHQMMLEFLLRIKWILVRDKVLAISSFGEVNLYLKLFLKGNYTKSAKLLAVQLKGLIRMIVVQLSILWNKVLTSSNFRRINLYLMLFLNMHQKA